MGIIDEFAAAADKLEALASNATPDMGAFDDIEDMLFPEDLAYIAAMKPEAGKLLATVFNEAVNTINDNIVHRAPRGLDAHPVSGSLLDLARLINGGAS